MEHAGSRCGQYLNDDVDPVAEQQGHVFIQADFSKPGMTARIAVNQRTPLVDTLPASSAWESWIFGHFRRHEIKDCTTITTGLPIGRDLDVVGIQVQVRTILTIKETLPLGHPGVLAVKCYWVMKGQSEEYRGQVWVLWSNSRLAEHATDELTGFQFKGVQTEYEVRTNYADDAFRFVRGNTGEVRDPRYGERILAWAGVRSLSEAG